MNSKYVLELLTINIAVVNDLLETAACEHGLQLRVHLLKPDDGEYGHGIYEALRLTQIIDLV